MEFTTFITKAPLHTATWRSNDAGLNTVEKKEAAQKGGLFFLPHVLALRSERLLVEKFVESAEIELVDLPELDAVVGATGILELPNDP